MYTFSSKLKTFSFILIALGIIGIAYGFLTVPKSTQEVEKMLADSHHGSHATDAHVVSGDAHATTDAHADKEHKEHVDHVFHQLKNKPWSAFYVACIFFLLIALGTLAFYGIQIAAQAGWSPVLFRVMEGITAYLLPGSIIFFSLLILVSMHFSHYPIFVWMDDAVVAKDHLLQKKAGFLNVPFFLIRAAIYLTLWNLYRYFSRRNSIKLDETFDIALHKKNFKLSAAFLVVFIVTESMMSWDWIMSVDPHWFSTLFGWYVFSSFFVSGITMITIITLYLKSKGYLEEVNKSHLQDLAKYMFAFSVFWAYLWFSQFMLIWYANIPEEVTYFVTRIRDYNLPFFGMMVLNFVFPILILMNADFKRLTWIVIGAGVVILFGHYIDFFVMIMPATVGDQWFIGVSEISSVLFFLGIFLFVVFKALEKAPLIAKGYPLMGESKHFHY